MDIIKNKSRILEAEIFLNTLYKPMFEDEFEYEKEHICLTSCIGWSTDKKPKARNFKELGYSNSTDETLKQIEKNIDRDIWLQICTNNGKSRNKKDTTYAHAIVLEIDFKNLKDPGEIEELCFRINEIQPGLIIHSGNGVHIYFLLDEPYALTPETLDKLEYTSLWICLLPSRTTIGFLDFDFEKRYVFS